MIFFKLGLRLILTSKFDEREEIKFLLVILENIC